MLPFAINKLVSCFYKSEPVYLSVHWPPQTFQCFSYTEVLQIHTHITS